MKTTSTTILLALTMMACSFSFGQKKVHTFQVTRVISAPAKEVWKVVGEDFGAIANSHPKIISSDYINGSLAAGEGAERVCNFNDSGTKFTHEKMVDYDPFNYTFKAVIFDAEGVPMNTEYSYAVYSVKAIDVKSCELSIRMQYRTKPAILGAMAKGGFKKTISDYALSVEHHVLTGEVVNRDNFKEIKKRYGS